MPAVKPLVASAAVNSENHIMQEIPDQNNCKTSYSKYTIYHFCKNTFVSINWIIFTPTQQTYCTAERSNVTAFI